MKKLCIHFLLALLVLTGCSSAGSCLDLQYSIVESSEHYRIFTDCNNNTWYSINDSSGKNVLTEQVNGPISITMLNDDIVAISVGKGTGISEKKYYSISRNLLSQTYTYVIANYEELVAYIDISKECPMENRKIVIQNIFDKQSTNKEFTLDFSAIDTPVVHAQFIESGTVLQIEYLSAPSDISKIAYLSLD